MVQQPLWWARPLAMSVGASLVATVTVAGCGSWFASSAPPPPTSDDACTTTAQGDAIATSLTSRTSAGGHQMLLESTSKRTAGALVETQLISADGQPLLRLEATRGSGPGTHLVIDYGAPFQGIRDVDLTTTDGSHFQGTIDGRSVAPFVAGADPKTLRFADGAALPDTRVAEGYPDAIAALLAKAGEDARSCKHPLAVGFTPTKAPAPVDPTVDPPGHGSATRHSAECAVCKGGAVAGGISCSIGVATGCAGTLIFYGVCLGIGLTACLVAEVAAQVICDNTVCCPVGCGGLACCFSSEICLNTDSGTCCDVGLNPCSGKSCCPKTDACLRDGTCCPPGRAVCGDACCGPFESCAAGRCCAKPCGSSCCGIAENCIDASHGTCCPTTSKVCGGACCDAGDECVGGKCCPGGQACGGICCPSGQRCQDPKTHSCAFCPAGQTACSPVDWNTSSPAGPNVCCSPGVACCGGACCGTNQVCCAPNGTPACHLRNECLR